MLVFPAISADTLPTTPWLALLSHSTLSTRLSCRCDSSHPLWGLSQVSAYYSSTSNGWLSPLGLGMWKSETSYPTASGTTWLHSDDEWLGLSCDCGHVRYQHHPNWAHLLPFEWHDTAHQCGGWLQSRVRRDDSRGLNCGESCWHDLLVDARWL